MLGDDKGKQGRFDAIRLPAEPAIAVFTAIQIMRHKSYETAFSRPGSELVVIVFPGPVLDHVHGHAASSPC